MQKKTRGYVGAYADWDTDAVIVWERDENGRAAVPYNSPYYMYVPDDEGPHKSIFGRQLKKLVFDSKDEMQATARQYRREDLHESDIPPLFKVLMDEYYEAPIPDVHYAFLDIEVDYSSEIGFSSPANPYAPINAVTIYQSWTKSYLTYAVPPRGWKEPTDFQAQIQAFWKEHKLAFEPNVVICRNEDELLKKFCAAIEDADIISGWNSEFFDLPYIFKRMERVNPRLVNKLSFTGCKKPRESTVERFGTPQLVIKLSGRTHLDYLDLFKKFTFEGRTSYSLANIANEELEIPKLEYDGTLEQLYKRDFVNFIGYNCRDVEVLVKLDDKFKFIALVNQMAHENTCLYENMLGTVRYVETGITNRCHNVHKLIVQDKRVMNDGVPVEGALVLSPLVGLHEWLGSVDIASLYPSLIRSLNISPEKYIGQFASDERDWRGIMEMDDELHHIVFADGESHEMTGAEWWKALVDKGWVISGYGTVFDESSGLGIVPEALEYWYKERQRLQAEKKKYTKLAKEETDKDKKLEYKKLAEHFDLLQLTKKIQLNSCYGALLSPHFRFGRKEMGASTTGSGRQVTTFMMEQIGELVTGKQCKIVKQQVNTKDGVQNIYRAGGDGGYVILLSDTDSCYFKTLATSKEEAIEVADAVAEAVNGMFPAFMRKAFNCQPGFDTLIKAGREIVGSRGLFLNAKKKYTIKVVNLDGFDLEEPKLKTVGSEMKKADTPKVIQDFLKELMNDLILEGAPYEDVEKFINKKRGELVTKIENPFSLGTAKSINNLDAKYAEWQATEKIGKGKVNLPGHVRAAVNYNELAQELDKDSKLLKSGDKGVVFYLMPNDYGITAIAFPSDLTRFPKWFEERFKLDKKKTEDRMIDSKIDRIFEAMNWEIPTPQRSMVKSVLKF